MNPSEARRRWEESLADSGGRLTPHPAFELLGDGFDFDRYFDFTESPPAERARSPLDLVELVHPAMMQEILAALPPGGRVRVVDADSGRGASGLALALEILDVLATVGGATAFAVGGAKGIRRIHEIITTHMGRRPVISVGAAKHLAAADLVDRLGTEEFRLTGAGETRDDPPDAGYTGEDNFYVVFEKERLVYFYLVEPDGIVHFVGEVVRNPTPFELSLTETHPEASQDPAGD